MICFYKAEEQNKKDCQKFQNSLKQEKDIVKGLIKKFNNIIKKNKNHQLMDQNEKNIITEYKKNPEPLQYFLTTQIKKFKNNSGANKTDNNLVLKKNIKIIKKFIELYNSKPLKKTKKEVTKKKNILKKTLTLKKEEQTKIKEFIEGKKHIRGIRSIIRKLTENVVVDNTHRKLIKLLIKSLNKKKLLIQQQKKLLNIKYSIDTKSKNNYFNTIKTTYKKNRKTNTTLIKMQKKPSNIKYSINTKSKKNYFNTKKTTYKKHRKTNTALMQMQKIRLQQQKKLKYMPLYQNKQKQIIKKLIEQTRKRMGM